MSAFYELVSKLKEIFQIDRADLDFGIYRILNSRSQEIEHYLNYKLPEAVKKALKDQPQLEASVYNHLLTFFSRYYESGDFISQRRYKGDTYAIPYNGEEVMMYWANKDQYYTKSGENFSNYRFSLEDGRQVQFRLVQADVEKDNRKDNESKRIFRLAEQAPTQNGDTLEIYFEYAPSKEKQANEISRILDRLQNEPMIKAQWNALFALRPTDKNAKRTLLEKQLTDYTSKNSADYFIHKDLGSFLRRELDFYIKNEVMNLDNIQSADDFAPIERNLKLIQTLRSIALDLIAFLAQLENFQKKLWLKKKFVADCHYLISLDKVPSRLLAEVLANPKQLSQWENLFNFQHVTPPANSAEFVKHNPHLIVDTSLFPSAFQAALLSELSADLDNGLDENIDGVLIHADNFQALNLLQARYREQVKCIYIDPPYNTGGDGFIYKDSYQHSSWLTLISNRLDTSYSLMKNNGTLITSIDDTEQNQLKALYNNTFGSENFIAQVIWERAYSPVNLKKHFSESHDYLIFYAKNKEITICNGLPRSEEGNSRYSNPDNDPRGNWKSSDLSVGPAITSNIYEITTPTGRKVMPPSGYSWRLNKERFAEYVADNRIWFGSDGNNVPSIKRFLSEVKNTVTPMTIWKYQDVGHSQSASQDLKKMFNEARFTYPKSVPLIQQSINLYSDNNSLILDYFAGSGTTAHAVINLNREDGGKRKYILVEQGEYFDTVLKPRVQKVLYAKDWKEGKPALDGENGLNGLSQIVKVLKLESYEDTLNNLRLEKADLFDSLPETVQTDYLLHYMLNIESRSSLLSTEIFQKPFDYQLNIARDSAGSYLPQPIDLVETFNYLLGLNVIAIRDKRERDGIVFVTGYLPQKTEQPVLIIWRDCELVDYKKLPELLAAEQIELGNKEFALVYINGDHNLPTVWVQEDGVTQSLKIRQIEAEFLRLMFEEAQ